MFKNINLRIIFIFVIVFVFLYSLFSFFFFLQYKTNNYEEVDLLESTPIVVVGKVVNSNKFAVKLDSNGEALIVFDSVVKFDSSNINQINVEIDNLPLNYQVAFLWINEKDSLPKELKLIQPNGRLQVDYLLKESTWIGKIKQLGLRISPQEHLGISRSSDSLIKINQISLSSPSYTNNYFKLINLWLKYRPWSYKSINHIKSNSELPFYAQLPVFMVVCLLLSLALIIYIFGSTQFVFTVIVAWLALDVLFLHNMFSTNEWVENEYDREITLLPDESLNKIAKQVKMLLGLDNTKKNKIKSQRVLILSTDRYHRARLIFHMLPVNSSFVDMNSTKGGKSKILTGDYLLSFDAVAKPLKPVNGIMVVDGFSYKVKQLTSGDDFVLMQVEK